LNTFISRFQYGFQYILLSTYFCPSKRRSFDVVFQSRCLDCRSLDEFFIQYWYTIINEFKALSVTLKLLHNIFFSSFIYLLGVYNIFIKLWLFFFVCFFLSGIAHCFDKCYTGVVVVVVRMCLCECESKLINNFSPSQSYLLTDFFFSSVVVFHFSLYYICKISKLFKENKSLDHHFEWQIIAATHSNSLLHSSFFSSSSLLWLKFILFLLFLSLFLPLSSLSIHCDGNAHTNIIMIYTHWKLITHHIQWNCNESRIYSIFF